MAKAHPLAKLVNIHTALIISTIILIAVPVMNKIPSEMVSQQSMRAGLNFLLLVDTEEYAESWEVSSDILKEMLSVEEWVGRIAKIRDFLGPIIERTHSQIAYTDSASDVPEGEYVILTFISKFEFRERVIEKLTLMLGPNDRWQVVGYFVR